MNEPASKYAACAEGCRSEITLDPEPPMALQAFCERLAVSATTVWRWRRLGWLETVSIEGRAYVTREAVRRFNARVASGEFSRPIVCAANNRRRAAA